MIYSFFFKKSEGIGGVEQLIRNFKALDINFKEIYYSENESDDLIPVRYSSRFFLISYIFNMFKPITKRFNAYKYFDRNIKKNDSVIIYHPKEIIFIPKRANIILVQTNKFEVLFKFPYGFLFKQYINNVNYFCVYTDIDKEKLISLYPELKKKVLVIPRGCKLKTRNDISNMSKKLVTICRIEEGQKNFSGMVDIMNSLPKEYSLDIYGDGIEEEVTRLKQKISDIDNVSYLGRTTDVASVLTNYSIFIMTSNYEGFGQSLIEARSQGLPIIVYNTFDAARWIVRDGQNGYLIKPYNIEDFCSKIITLSSDNNKYIDFSSRSLELAIETELDMVNEKWIDLLG